MFWRGRHKFAYIESVGVAIGFGGQSLMGGKTYFVNCRSGNDNHPGTNPREPLATLEAAEAKCVANKNDYIFAQEFWTLTTESPIIFDKAKMHVIGLGSGILFDNGNDIGAKDSLGIAVVLKECTDLELAGFNIGGDATKDAISVIGTTFRVHLHHCTFGNNYACLDGIGEGAAGNMGKWLVEDCLFGILTAGDGINCSMLSSYIKNSVFRQKTGKVCIDVPAGQTWNTILDNLFYASVAGNEAKGWAITLPATCALNIVKGNRATECGDGTGDNPYLDESAGSLAALLNGWVENYDGNALAVPDYAS